MTSLVPVLDAWTIILPSVAFPRVKSMCVIVSSLTSISFTVIEPIHAATAIETPTVTATSMMAATTGLRAFLLFRAFVHFWLDMKRVILQIPNMIS